MNGISRTIFGKRRSWLGRFPSLQHQLRARYLARHALAVPVGGGMILCRILGPYKLYVDPDDLGISPHLMLDGYWEPRVTEVIVDRMRPGMIGVDVGANLGYFSVLMAALVGPRGRVLAFEPNPETARRFENSLAINGMTERVSLYRDALAEVDGREVNLVIPENHPGGSQVTSIPVDGLNHVTARTRRLDGVPGALDAALVKIDCEGAEEAIWRGMSAMDVQPECVIAIGRLDVSMPSRVVR